MATLASPSASPRRRKSFARKCERYCCYTLQYFPLVFVHGLTTWAIWVELSMSFLPGWKWPIIGHALALLGTISYILLNWSYTTAVFTNPGSTIEPRTGYSVLPTTEARPYSSFTVKSTGDIRFCKKCQAQKPDRAHHCSTCRRCVLKMDHHCPWLATCVGLRNYKAFVLFVVYTAVFCWICFVVSGAWIWQEIIVNGVVEDSLMPVNYILLAVLSGIIGLVLTGFSGWHIYLVCKGTTTIESLEKTRYMSPIRQQMATHVQPQRTYVDSNNHTITEQLRDLGDTLTEIHANALPGVLRSEEGEERLSPSTAQNSLQRHLHTDYEAQERQRDRDRYNEYLDELDSEKLPNAFDLGWRRNATAVFGPVPYLWWLPICNSLGDGWSWEASQHWLDTRDNIKVQRERERATEPNGAGTRTTHSDPTHSQYHHNGVDRSGQPPNFPSAPDHEEDQITLTYGPRQSWDSENRSNSTPLQSLPPRSNSAQTDDYDDSSDEEQRDVRAGLLRSSNKNQARNWNDIPDDFVDPNAPKRNGIKSKRNR